MTEPKRWLDEGPPEAIERLLHAAAAERPTDQSLSRTLTMLGVGAGASGAAATAGAATAAGAGVAPGAAAGGALGVAAGAKATGLAAVSALVKWGVVVVALGAVGVAGRGVLKRAESPASNGLHSAAPTVVAPPARPGSTARVHATSAAPDGADRTSDGAPVAQVPPAPSAETSIETVSERSVRERVSARTTSTSARSTPSPATLGTSRNLAKSEPTVVEAPPPPDSERLAEEVALVDRARGALASGDAAAALAALDDYEARFSPPKFAPEALYLRMEALLHQGRSGAARSVAERLAGAYPKSPHAARARQVLAQTIP